MSEGPQARHPHELFIERAEATGRWWEDPWWADNGCEIHFTVTREAVSRGAAAICQHFDDTWYRELVAKPRPNLIFPKLCLERSTFALEFIASFGAQLERLSNAANIERPMRAMRETYGDSALLELEAADAFVQSGFAISFPAEGSTRTPDILVSSQGQEIAVECKRLGDEQWEDWEGDLMHEITRALPHQYEGREIVAEIALNPRLSEIRFGGSEYRLINEAVLRTLKRSILASIEASLREVALPHEFMLPDIARVRLSAKAPGLYGGVSGMERSVPATFRRIFQNAVFRGLEQLPKGRPGAIVVFSKHAPPPEFFRLLFDAAADADHGRFEDLVGIMVCTLQTWFERPKPWLFMNHYTRHERAAALVCDALKQGFGARMA